MFSSPISKVQIKEAKKGSPRALALIMQHYQQLISLYVQKRIKNKNDTQDIVMMSFTKAFSKLDTYNEDAPFKPWIMAIAKNTLIDFIRKNKRYSADYHINIEEDLEAANDLSDAQHTPENMLISEENMSRIMRFIEQMPDAYKKVIQLRYMEELSNEEIANQLKINVNNVKVRLVRARRKLWDQIAKFDS